MPDRLFQMTAPIAQYHATRDGRAVQAILMQAAHEAAMQGVLMGRGIEPGAAQMLIDQWRAQGLFTSPSVFAPGHVAEAVLTGTAVPTTQQILRTQPQILGYASMLTERGPSLAQAHLGTAVSPLQKALPVQAISPLQKALPTQVISPLQKGVSMQAVSPFANPWHNPSHTSSDWSM